MTGNYFTISRNVELSTIYYLETEIENDWSNITVTKMMPNVGEKRASSLPDKPIVVSRLKETETDRFELGNNRLRNSYLIIIDIFARSDGQRIDLAGYILDKLKDSWVYYTHSHGSDPSTLERVADGNITVERFLTNTKIDIFDSPENFDKYRHSISISVRRSNFR